MTAIIAVHTPKFVVVASDTLLGAEGSAYYCKKLLRLESGVVIGGAGETGPIWRKLESEASWKKIQTINELYQKVLGMSDLTDRVQMEGGDCYLEAVIAASHEGIIILDNAGSKAEGIQIEIGGHRLPARFEAIGSGREFCLAFVLGYFKAMSYKDARVELRSQSRVEELLKVAIKECSKYITSVGGAVEVEILRNG